MFKTKEETLYGTILTDDNLIHICKDEGDYVRIRIIACEGVIYYHKTIDGEIVEFKKVGVVG